MKRQGPRAEVIENLNKKWNGRFGEALRLWRLEKGRSVEALASQVGSSAVEITRFEKGVASLKACDFCRLADYLEATEEASFLWMRYQLELSKVDRPDVVDNVEVTSAPVPLRP